MVGESLHQGAEVRRVEKTLRVGHFLVLQPARRSQNSQGHCDLQRQPKKRVP